MKEFIKIPYGIRKIFLDFDGVLVDSNKFKEIAIEKSIKFYEKDLNIVNKSLITNLDVPTKIFNIKNNSIEVLGPGNSNFKIEVTIIEIITIKKFLINNKYKLLLPRVLVIALYWPVYK